MKIEFSLRQFGLGGYYSHKEKFLVVFLGFWAIAIDFMNK